MNKKYIALLANDLHCQVDTISDFRENWKEMLEVAEDYKVQRIVLGGDLFTSRAAQNLHVLLAVKEMVQTVAKSIPLTIIDGNHDKIDQTILASYNDLFDVVNNVNVVKRFSIISFDGTDVVIVAISYFPEDKNFCEMLEEAVEETKCISTGNKLLYIHEGIHGALGDFDIPGELPNDIFGDFDKVLVGHYHNRTLIKDTNIQYIGSSRQANFGEDEEKGYTVVASDGSLVFVKNEANVRYMTLGIDFDEINDNLKMRITHHKNEGYKVRLKIKCTESQASTLDKLSLIEAGVNKIDLKTERMDKVQNAKAADAISEKYDKNGIMKEYQIFCGEKNIDSSLGLSYLKQLN